MPARILGSMGDLIQAIGADFDEMPDVDGVAVVEYGSNSDGEYIRLADGTQVCWKSQSGGAQLFTARTEGSFSGYISAELWEFPAAFIDADIVAIAQVKGADGGTNATISGAHPDSSPTTGTVNFRYWASVSIDSWDHRGFLAIGRWF